MAFKIRRGLESERTTITPLEGEPLYTTDTHLLYIGDGSTAGGNLVGGASYFSAMTDVDVAGVSDGYFLTYDAFLGKWVVTASTGSESITELSGLTDVDTSTALDGQVLTYVLATDTWSAITSSVGVTDHGLLSGREDDDHTQYHNDTRAEIWLTGNNHDVISATTMTAETINAGVVKFDVDYDYVVEEGELRWNSTQSCLEVGMPGGNVIQQIGQEFLVRVRNNTDSTITNGTVVMNTGSHANHPTIAPATASASTPTMQVGMATEDIAANNYGFVCLQGFVNDVDTTNWTEGTSLYLSASTPADGSLTDTPPMAPNHNAWMCVVTVGETTSGQVYFKPVLPMTLENISDVNGTTPDTTNKYLVWNDTNKYWDANPIYFSGVSNTAHTHDHSSLDGLGDDDHLQYLTEARADDWLTGNVHTVISATTITGGTVLGVDFSDVSNTAHTHDFSVITNTGHTHTESEITDLGDYVTGTQYIAHTGDPSIHLSLDDVETQITGTTHDEFSAGSIIATTITATTYQGIDFSMVANTSHTHDFSVITNTGHTHTESDITDLGDYAERTYFESHTGDPTTHFTEASIVHDNIQNVGTNTHAQIDTHISNTNIHLSLNDVETQITGITHDVLSAATIAATTYQGIDSSMVANTAHTHDEYFVWDSKSATFRETRADEDSTLFIVTNEIYIESAMTIMVGTTPTVDWRIMTGASRSSGTEIFSGQSIGYTTIDYFSGDTTLSTIGTIVWLETTATGGTSVDEFHITIKYSGA